NTLFQDSKGYMWVSTDVGLSRFDGMGFENFTVKDGIFPQPISSIHEDKQGNLWFRSRNFVRGKKGLMKYDGNKFTIIEDELNIHGGSGTLIYRDQHQQLWFEKDGKIYNDDIQLVNQKAFDNNYIYDAYIIAPNHYFLGTITGFLEYKDSVSINHTKNNSLTTQIHKIIPFKNQIWLSTDEGLMRFEDGKFINDIVPKEIKRNVIHNAQVDQKGDLWMATLYGLYQFDGKEFKRYTTDDGLLTNRITHLFIDSKNNVWISSKKGLMVYSCGQFIPIDVDTRVNLPRTFYRNVIRNWNISFRQILEDHEGNIWFNTTKGIAKFTGFGLQNVTEDNLLVNNSVSQVLQDQKGNTWFAYLEDGVSICKGKECQNFNEENGLPDNRVYDLVETKDGTVWLGTYGGLVKYEKGKFQKITIDSQLPEEEEVIITQLLLDHKDRLWVLAMFSQLYCYENGTFKSYTIGKDNPGYSVVNGNYIPMQHISCLYAAEDTVWVAGREGLFQLDAAKDSFLLKIHHDYVGTIVDMSIDKDGNFWMIDEDTWRSEEGSLVRYDGKFTTRFNPLKGLNSNILYGIEIVDDGAWIITNQGIDYLDIGAYNENKRVKIESFSRNKGISGVEYTNLLYKTPSDHLWFGTQQGLIHYQSEQSTWRNDFDRALAVQITDLKLNYEDVEWIAFANRINPITTLPEGLELSYEENTLTFSFKTLTFSDPQQVRYQYRLKGYEETWQPAGVTQQTVTYKHLNWGNYAFEVQAKLGNSDWETVEDITQFSFAVLPPIWAQTWFWVGIITCILGVGLTFLLIRKIWHWAFRRSTYTTAHY
ncbi:MAG: two-component regulator propeller domain-containing protein, partial [Chitinophagales bacterium]